MGERRKLSEAERIEAGLPSPDEAREILSRAEAGGVPEQDEEDDGYSAADWARLAVEVGSGAAAVAGAFGPGGLPVAAGGLALRTAGRMALSKGITAGAGAFAGSLASEAFDPSENPIERAKGTAVVDAFGEGVIGPAVNRAIQGGSTLVKGGREYIEDAFAGGQIPSVGRAVKNRAIDIIEGISEKSFFGGGSLAEAGENTIKFFDDAANAFADLFTSGASKEGVEDLVSLTISNGGDAFRKAGGAHYAAMDNLIEESGSGAKVNLGEVLERAAKIADEGLPGAGDRLLKGLRKRIREAYSVDTGVLDQHGKPIIMEIPEDLNVTFELASQLRSDLLGIGRQSQDLIGDKASAMGKRLAPLLDRAMQKAAKGAGPEVTAAWRGANKFWKDGVEKFNTQLIKRIAKKKTQSVFAAIKGANPRVIRQVKNAIDDDKVWSDVQGHFLLDLFNDFTNPEDVVLNGKALANKIRKLERDGGFTAIMGEAGAAGIKRLSNALKISQGPIGKNLPGPMMIQLMQAGAALSAFTFNFDKYGVAILAVPSVAAKLFKNPRFIKWAALGITTKPGTKAFVNAMGQMVSIAAAEGAEITGSGKDKPLRRPRSTPFSATVRGPSSKDMPALKERGTK